VPTGVPATFRARMGFTRLLLVVFVAVLVVASDAPAGGIADEPCPNVAGENTNTCPSGTVGAAYSLRFVEREGAGCGRGRQTFHLDSGLLPTGLTLNTDGTLSGTPLQVGRFQFYVQMREPQNDPATCAGKRTEKQFTLKIRNPVSIVSTPPVAPRSEVGVPFRMTLRARGGTGVFAWALVGGKLPKGVRIHANGSIVGTPGAAGTYRITARARDTEARYVSWAVTLSVMERLRIRRRRLPAAQVGRPYTADLGSTGGVLPTTWRLERGLLPPGIRLAKALGRLRGVPKKAGRYHVTVRVSDGLDVKSAEAFTILVRPASRPMKPGSRPGTRPRSASAPG
jgi:large repetitive protein